MSWSSPDSHVFVVSEVVTAATLNTYVRLNLDFLYGDTSWTAPTLTNGWVDSATGGPAVGFRLIGTRVVMRGNVKSGTLNTSAFTLPVGYRPTATISGCSESNSAFGVWIVTAAGAVTPATGSNLGWALNQTTFDTI
jgi:hypothetical protein